MFAVDNRGDGGEAVTSGGDAGDDGGDGDDGDDDGGEAVKHAKAKRMGTVHGVFSMSRLRSAGSAAQPRSSSHRTKAVNFLTG